ncbi:hypothetical protein EUGRSUZ_J00557 [Eucalyptus grandis]|uniref:Uncharacterized protein n=2 Tax=Eucalyptus grandis TaxID=71139 RepID=A0ACC3J3L8_EUCGR|nr:hypothetical protein EUGRSUZ_J00557 [Eucalyptus grandis]
MARPSSVRTASRDRISYNDSDFWRQLIRKQSGAASSSTSLKMVNVNDYGAKGDGSDDTEAFTKAWEAACSAQRAVLVVPQNKTYGLTPITFSGPCGSDLTVKIYGTIEASSDQSAYEKDPTLWLKFENLTKLSVAGGGYINGNGETWWQKSCKRKPKPPCKHAPTALTFQECKYLRVADLTITNAQQMHLVFKKCVNVSAVNLQITAPKESPNTDGIHVTDTQNITIDHCAIGTGDDCISIVSGSSNVQATDIACGPGHGISIGSLGAHMSADYVSNVVINNSRLSGTTNGVRIKTWQGGSGYASNIRFENLAMDNVTNPIIIDQNYCDQEKPCPPQAAAVQVRNVTYTNIRGTSASEEAIKFDCSRNHPCEDIFLQDINLRSESSVKSTEASCLYVRPTQTGIVSPRCD